MLNFGGDAKKGKKSKKKSGDEFDAIFETVAKGALVVLAAFGSLVLLAIGGAAVESAGSTDSPSDPGGDTPADGAPAADS